MKICTICKIEKDECEFTKRSDSKDGFRKTCKSCAKDKYKQNRLTIIQKRKIYYKKNQIKIILNEREYYQKNKDKISIGVKAYREKNENYFKKYRKSYYQKNKQKFYEKYNLKIKNDIEFKIQEILRNRIRSAIKNQYGEKSYKSMELLGCDIEMARNHIESQFSEGMSWENYGFYSWHIDHIKPCASFDLTNPEEQKKCFHYTNLQPLWAKENLKKGCKI